MKPTSRSLRAPVEDGQKLIDPPWQVLPERIEANRRAAASINSEVGGLPFQEVRRLAQTALLKTACASLDPTLPIVVSGHQPELFHPGVWFKNFSLGKLSSQVHGQGVNLVIDNDLCREASIRVPTGGVDSPHTDIIPLDAPTDQTPFEERGIVDWRMLESFPQRVQETLGGLIERPLVHELWPDVLSAASSTGNLGSAISAARHAMECRWGLETFEVPLSVVCDSLPFHLFASHVLTRLASFREAYNGALAEYRAAHGIRTPAQPVPNLHQQGDWLETPFWVWSEADPTRRPLYAQVNEERPTLSDLNGGEWTISPTAEGLSGLRIEQGVKVRPRALITTMFARMFLADLFLHGIGGAVYDQVTDRIAERFFGFAPPPHATVTATLRLPIEHESATPDDLRRIDRQLREMKYHPEAFLASNPEATHLTEWKHRWIATPKTPDNAWERHQNITKANASMQPLLSDQRGRLLNDRLLVAQRLKAARVLGSREYSFCLFPEEKLRDLLL